MKKIIFSILILSSVLPLSANNTSYVDYNRASVSVILVQGKGRYQTEILSQKGQVVLSDRFFMNPISTTTVSGRDEKAVRKELVRNHVAAQCMNVWRNLDTLYSRTQYNLSTSEIAQMKASSRGFETYKDERWFKQLIQNNYILVIQFDDLKSLEECYTKREVIQWIVSMASLGEGGTYVKRTMEGYTGKATAYLYRVVMDNEDYASFLLNWDNSAAHNQYPYKIELVKKIRMKAIGGKAKTDPGNAARYFLNQSCEKALDKISKRYLPLAVQSSITDTHPVMAEVGTREGLEAEDLVDVYTLKETQSGTIKYKWTTGVRVNKLAYNTSLNDREAKSSFYNVGWGKCQEGQILIPRRTSGVSLMAGVSLYSALSYKFSVGYSLTRMIESNTATRTKLFLEFGFSDKFTDQNGIFAQFAEQTGNPDFLKAGKLYTYFYGIGIQYDVNILPPWQISPYLSFMVENSFYANRKVVNEIMGDYKLPLNYGHIVYPQIGVRMPISITPNVKIVPAISYAFKINKLSMGAGASSVTDEFPIHIIKKDKLFIDILLQIDL